MPLLPLAVAYSGGADSTALLLACAQKWPGKVSAVHVHHGLQEAADGFAAHCVGFCLHIGVSIEMRHVQARPRPGQSPEEAARNARYKAFSEPRLVTAAGADVKSIALAHHADDQVETMLLALSRGAGLPGLAAMAAEWHNGPLSFHRPLLQVPGAVLRNWLVTRGVGWIEDPTNADPHFTRNRIRAQLLPALEAAFPACRTTFARSAAHAAQGAQLLAELGAEDLGHAGDPPAIERLRALSAARLSNLLRYWLRSTHATTPSTAQLAELTAQINHCATRGHRICLKIGAGFVERRGPHLHWYNSPLLKSSAPA